LLVSVPTLTPLSVAPQDAGLAQLLGLRSHRELRESPDLAASWRDVCVSARAAGRLDAPAPTSALQTLGCVLASLGRFNEAVPVLETCVSALEQAGAPGSSSMLCDALLNLAAVTDAAGRPEDAAAVYARAAATAGGELQKAECLVSQGAVLHRLARLDAAQEVLESAYQLASCLGATVAGMRAQGSAAHALALVLIDAKRQTADALRLLREALSMGDQSVDCRGEGDGDEGAPSYEADALARLVALLHTRLPAVCDDVDAALEAATASPSANGAMSSPRAAHSAFHPDPDMPVPSDLAAACEDAATRLVAHGASEAAVQLMERSLALLTAALGTDNHNIGAAAERLAALHAVAGRWEDARPLFERALRVAEATARAAEISIADRAACAGPGGGDLVKDTPPVLHAAHNLAACLEALERWDQAAALRQRVLRSSERGGGDAFAVAKAAHAAAACEEAQAHGTEAQVLYEKALRMFDSAAPKADSDASEGTPEYELPGENTMHLLDLPTWPALHRSDPLRSAPAVLARSAARTCNALAMLHRSRGHPAAAAPLLLRSLALRRAACDNDEEVSVALTNLAGLLRSLGRGGDAVPLLRACVAIWDPNDGHVPTSATLEDDAAVRAAGAHHNLGLALRESGMLVGGLASAARSVSLYVAALGEAHPHTRAARQSLDACMAAVLAHANAQDWATELANKSVAAHASGRLLEALLLHTPLIQVLASQEAEARDRVAAAEDTHARLLLTLGKPTEAVPHAQRALHAAAAVLGPESLDVAAAAAMLGQCLDMCGQPGAATPHLGRALELREKLLGANHPSVGDTLLSLGTLWEKLSRREDAERCFRRAVAVGDVCSSTCTAAEAATAAGATARALNALGLLLHATERAAEAKQGLQRSLALRCAADASASDVAVATANLGTVHLTLNELDEAVACYTRALNLWTAAAAGSLTLDAQARAAGTLSSLGLIARKRGRFREAAAFLERSQAAWAAVASHGGDDAKHDDAMKATTVALEGVRRQLANTAHDGRDDEDEDAAAAWAAAATCVSLLNLNECTDATDKPR
jgi:tetratricopeptide (TPR) repeat protein